MSRNMTSHSRRWICALAFVLFVALPIEVSAQKVALLGAGVLDRAQDVKAKLIAAGIAQEVDELRFEWSFERALVERSNGGVVFRNSRSDENG